MPKYLEHVLIWEEAELRYQLQSPGQKEQWDSEGDEGAFSCWLDEHTAFAFVGPHGRISVFKEARGGNREYWYACCTHHRRTHKRYLGPSSRVTFARLEEIAKELSRSFAPIPPFPPSSASPWATLLKVKLSPPRLPIELVERERLLRELDAVLTHPLTLVSASAGSGKTTLLSTWTKQRTDQVAWLTLDEQDNDPARFWISVISSLRHSGSPVGEAALAMLQSPQPSLLTGALTSLINELAALAQNITLILDDYHLIREPEIHDSLQFLLDHLPPCLHLCLSSRVEPSLPLARLRARGQLLEIREIDLRLREDEAISFLTQIMHLSLTEEEVASLEFRTEGWIAGLQLAALSLRRHTDVSAFLQAFTGSHRFIFDYVQEEILTPLPQAQQRFLLYTSVLERMNAALCQTLTGETASQQMLGELEQANLFLIPLDEDRRWYRFHTLFREVLLASLQAREPELLAHLHREAALWYQRQGSPRESIPYALATHDFSFVAELLEGCVEGLYLQGGLKTLLVWMNQLPVEVLLAHPRLATSYILVFNMLFPFSEQQPGERANLHQLQSSIARKAQNEDQTSLSQAERDRLSHRLAILDGWIVVTQALSHGNVELLSELAERWQHMSLDDDLMWQQHRLAAFAIAWRMAGNFPPMVAALQEVRKMTWITHNRYQEVQILWGLIAALIALGELRLALDHCELLRGLINSLGEPLPVAAYPDLFQAQLAYAWNDLQTAQNAARTAIEKTAPLQYMDILMGAYEVLARVCMAQDDLTGAQQAIHEMECVNRSAGIPLARPWIEGLWSLLWLAQGDLTRAADWANHTPYRLEAPAYTRESVHLALARVYLAQQHYPQALHLLSALLSSTEQVSRLGSMISILALQVAALQASGARQEALHVLHRLLTLAEPKGHQRVFLDAGAPMQQALHSFLATERLPPNLPPISPALASYARALLAAFAHEPHRQSSPETSTPGFRALPLQTAQSLLKPLTPRELEVLRLLAEGASNQETARRLVISLATAKKHVASILSKLGAENRTQAIAHARLHSLLS